MEQEQSFEMRPMEKGDIDAVCGIIGSYCHFDGDHSRAYYAEYFTRVEAGRAERERNFVACDKATGKVIGVCGFAPDKYKLPDILWLTWFYMDKNQRGRGVGTSLLKKAIRDAMELGARKIYLDTGNEDFYQDAVKMYNKFGFIEEGLFLDYFREGHHSLIFGLDCSPMKGDCK
ncbi:GNAT family N-acetyltransferase [Candidatus Sumerlaeota bacterium]|nr:GNAT family N-acetyltransferase [Candidatus Sumerlaeota bacterium]